jgi:hypothetical protein
VNAVQVQADGCLGAAKLLHATVKEFVSHRNKVAHQAGLITEAILRPGPAHLRTEAGYYPQNQQVRAGVPRSPVNRCERGDRLRQGLIVAKTETNLDVETVLAAPGQCVLAGQRGGGCEIRAREGLPPTRFPSVRPSVHGSPCPSVTWDDRNRWVSADARELRRMRLRMRPTGRVG